MFKVWSKKSKCWVGGLVTIFQDGTMGRYSTNTKCFDILGKEEFKFVKCTGLKDKNGEEIYEGDIVEIGNFKYSIKFEIGSFMLVRCSGETDMYAEFDNCWNDDVYPLCQLYWESNADEDTLYNCEVVGNIYENSKLLDA